MFLLLALVALCQGDELFPVPDPISEKIIEIRLPTVPVTTEPDQPAPAPSPVVPGTVLVDSINDGELYVFESDTEIKVTGSPDGVISVASKKGPRSFTAKFVDGVDRAKYEDRTYEKPFVYVVQAVKTGQCELLVFTGVKDDLVRQMLTVTIGPRPPPGPVPPGPTPPGPTPPGPTPPGPVTSFRVIFVKESGQTLNKDQTPIPTAKVIRDYLDAKTTPEDGTVGWRTYDPQMTTENEPPALKRLWTAAKPSITTVPCLVVEVNGNATVMPFPVNVADAMKILKEAGGQ